MNGHFVVSLDYEIHWGVFDKKSVNDYKENLENVSKVIDRLLDMSSKYDVKLTFCTVGLLFAKDKNDLLHHLPQNKPTYSLEKLNPYQLLDSIGHDETDDSFHYANSKIKEIRDNGNHEIGTHTFSHFNCHAPGQTPEQFDEDLKASINIAKALGITIKSIVFPKNQINPDDAADKPYLQACKKYGITSFRGKEKSFIYNIHSTKTYRNLWIFRALKPLDAYVNLTGTNTYDARAFADSGMLYNIPSSRFLRPFNRKLKYFEPLKLKRIKKAMTYAAKNNQVYHLWWHPHNFGKYTEENFNTLETVFKTYKALHETYGFQSETMTGLTDKVKSAL
ncbi:polysaccharide deacetylase family protein [uncultured Psychroserpens sp.]|uniref:polysaccharide deacetylase family protein n=1 Tax=uncultured Psychroserpens sp. TaxID=255436 RepID=UPI0026111137|nr:polysaccharide deacetylase family protein [uncultured Psychroserpens sp.]